MYESKSYVYVTRWTEERRRVSARPLVVLRTAPALGETLAAARSVVLHAHGVRLYIFFRDNAFFFLLPVRTSLKPLCVSIWWRVVYSSASDLPHALSSPYPSSRWPALAPRTAVARLATAHAQRSAVPADAPPVRAPRAPARAPTGALLASLTEGPSDSPST